MEIPIEGHTFHLDQCKLWVKDRIDVDSQDSLLKFTIARSLAPQLIVDPLLVQSDSESLQALLGRHGISG